MSGADCTSFEEQMEALALGQVAEPERSRMNAHVASCRSCRVQLDDMVGITDALLLLAPVHEPAPGFESRVLDRLNTSAPQRSARAATLLGVAAALLLIVAALGAVAIDRRQRDEALRVAGSGVIVAASGVRVGDIRLVSGQNPFVLIAIDNPRPGSGPVTCQLQLADGRTVIIGSWSYDDVRAGMWAAGIDASLLAAVGMQVVDSSGGVVASASLQG